MRIDLDPAALARAYAAGGAAALSVLTDRDFFKGSPEDLMTARQAVQLPVLRKDFLISDYQVYESGAMGADAVLLICRILSRNNCLIFLPSAGHWAWMPWLKSTRRTTWKWLKPPAPA